jgi:hypothetical protein
MNNDLKIIKKKYGENFSKLCRKLFPSILEEDGTLTTIITSLFKENHFLYDDLIEYNMVNSFQKLIMNEYGKKINNVTDTDKNPYELFKEKGYTLKECQTNEEILSYKKYYAKGEELCTFNDNRLKTNRVFFAVKDNALEIKRKSDPKREDEYGTSVLSLQFTIDTNYLSIKNRYNHTVKNPDATYQNNLENIAEGLTYSFEKYLGIKQSNAQGDFEIPNYVRAADGKYYRYNFEVNNKYYCPDNIIVDNFKEVSFPKGKYILFDGFLLDLVDKKLENYDSSCYNAAETVFSNIKSIKIENNGDTKGIYIICEDDIRVYFQLNKYNQIISVVMDGVEIIPSCFLENSSSIKTFSSKDTIEIYDYFLTDCEDLEYLYLPKCKTIGDMFACSAKLLKSISLPNVRKIEDEFLTYNKLIENIYMPNLETVGRLFLKDNSSLKEINLPKLKKVGVYFLKANNSIESAYLPELLKVGRSFLRENTCLRELYVPMLKDIDNSFLENNQSLEYLSLPEVETIGNNVLSNNTKLKSLYTPKIQFIGINFLENKQELLDSLCIYSQSMHNLLSTEENKVKGGR